MTEDEHSENRHKLRILESCVGSVNYYTMPEIHLKICEAMEAYHKANVEEYDSFLIQLLANYNLPEINDFIISQSLKQK